MRVLAVCGLALLMTGSAFAESRDAVLERISPVGKVTVEGQAAPAPAAAPAAATEAAPAAAEATAKVEEAAAPAAEAAAPAAEAAAAAPVVAAAAAAGGEDAQAIAQASGCLACHQVEVKVVGPSYKEVAAKYKGDAGALDMLVEKVKAGGVGTWGQIPMPPNAHVAEDKIRTVVEWVLSL